MSSDLKTDYTSEALLRLLSTLQGGTNYEALASSFIDRCQELETAAHPMLEQRSIDLAEGDRLDRIGAIVIVPRGGRDDDDYRLRIRAELAILQSNGTALDLINILQLLTGQASTTDIKLDEYFPKTVYMRPQNHILADVTEAGTIQALLRRAVSAATNLQLIYTLSEVDDDNLFRFSDTSGTPETSSSKGFGNGTFTGVTN